MSGLDLTLDPKPATVRRIEVITGGGGGRRQWSDEEKAQAIEASLAPGAVVSQVARRHGLTPQQLFTWRRELRRKAQADQEPRFVPAVLDEPTKAPALAEPAATASAPVIEVDINDAHVRIWPSAEPALTTAVLRALRPTGAR